MEETIDNCPVCEKKSFSPFLDIKDHFLTGELFSIQKCDTCGFKFIDPRPDKMEIGRYYQSEDYISHDAKKSNIISRIYKLVRVVSIKSKYILVRKHVQHGMILDIGCGTGEFLHYCNSRGFDVTGVEPNDKANQYAQEVNGIPVFKRLSEMPENQGCFHCITMWHVLEHVHDLNETIRLVKSRLHPDGIFIVAVPNCNSWDAKEYGKFWAAYDVPRHLYHFTAATMKKLVANHGFEIRKKIPQKFDAYYVSMLSEKYRTGRNNYFKALFFGFWSNLQAGKYDRGSSSQIFVLSLKKS
ncbi:MAG: methyltransferase domain-containing protein [Bacteroidales bacterium]|nr:methyltransferase domain-containing protein [Bacteroidales bacterium]